MLVGYARTLTVDQQQALRRKSVSRHLDVRKSFRSTFIALHSPL